VFTLNPQSLVSFFEYRSLLTPQQQAADLVLFWLFASFSDSQCVAANYCDICCVSLAAADAFATSRHTKMQCLQSHSARCSIPSITSNKQSVSPCCRPAQQQHCSTVLLPAAAINQARRAVTAAAAKSSPKGKDSAASGKGFGPAKPQKVVDEGCPCGSNQYYKVS
jgi:hypothetical protein